MSSNQPGSSPTPKDVFRTINLNERERRLAAESLARSEHAVALLFAAGNAVATLVVSVLARLRHSVASSRSWFAH